MDKKKKTYNYAKAKIENKQNSMQDFSVEFGKENTFDQVNYNKDTLNANNENEGLDKNNKKYISRNKKNNRHGRNNKENKN